MPQEFDPNNFERQSNPNKKITFGELLARKSFDSDQLEILAEYKDKEIDLDSFCSLQQHLDKSSEGTGKDYKKAISIEEVFDVACDQIAKSNSVIDSRIYDLLWNRYSKEHEKLLEIAANPNISSKLIREALFSNCEIVQAVSSNSSPRLKYPRLASIPKKNSKVMLGFRIDQKLAKIVDANISQRFNKLSNTISETNEIYGTSIESQSTDSSFNSLLKQDPKNHKKIPTFNIIDLVPSIQACNEIATYFQNEYIEPNYKETAVVKHEEVKAENLKNLLDSRNPESLVGVVARITEFFAVLESTVQGKAQLSFLLKTNIFWIVAYKFIEDFRIQLEDKIIISPENPDLEFEIKRMSIINLKIDLENQSFINDPIFNAATKNNKVPKVIYDLFYTFSDDNIDAISDGLNSETVDSIMLALVYHKDARKLSKLNQSLLDDHPNGAQFFRNITLEGFAKKILEKRKYKKIKKSIQDLFLSIPNFHLDFTNQSLNKNDEKEVVFGELKKVRDMYKDILSKLQKTELPSAEELQLLKMAEIEEQKLIAESEDVIAQKEYDEILETVGDPVEYAKYEKLQKFYTSLIEKLKPKSKIQPFLRSFWDDVSQNIVTVDQLKFFDLPNTVIEGKENVLESNSEAKAMFFRLITNLFIGNGKITRGLNPDLDPSISSPQSQIKDFYKQLCTKYIPAAILDENEKVTNQAEVDNNIFENPNLKLPEPFLEITLQLLEKLKSKYEEKLKGVTPNEPDNLQDNFITDLKNERVKIDESLDLSLSDLIKLEIEKVELVACAIKKSLEVR